MKIVAAALVAGVLAVGTAFAGDVIEYPSSMGKVTFDHKKHQGIVKDCKSCHEKGPGKIEGFGKDLAHKSCKGCHQEKKQGPTSCKDCHRK